MSLFTELKRHNVVRVGIAYVVIGWFLAQITEFAFCTGVVSRPHNRTLRINYDKTEEQ